MKGRLSWSVGWVAWLEGTEVSDGGRGGWGPFQMIRKARGIVQAPGFELLLVRGTLQGGGGLNASS